MRSPFFPVICAAILTVAGPVRADDVARARPQILPLTHQIMDTADAIKKRQVSVGRSIKNVVKEITGEPENLFVRFEHECAALHGRARDLETNQLLDKVGMQHTRLEKEVSFLEAFDRVDATAATVGHELKHRGADRESRSVFQDQLRPALGNLRDTLPMLAAYRGYRSQRRVARHDRL